MDATDPTFLTEYKHIKEKHPQDRVNEYLETLQAEIAVLNNKIDDALKSHEEDYLRAFRCQMQKIFRQLRELKMKTDENELKLKRDTQIESLTQSLR